ncbi:uncharacterized protein LOC107431188 [Ziziphus jujuba]|uniref:Uncharacterized protein LOC107431188 n=1 Tax=Ziziphus jujuba TaxID=326968 RepID=A0A6P4B657_ZIZJJ|nr:uncharacterized protein LOC107431188 [Ziziphus jujuba]
MAYSVTWYVETQGKIHMCISLLVGIPLIFFSSNGFCIDSSSFSSKDVTSDSDFDSYSSVSSFYCSSNKYIMKSYSEKYESLQDPDFQEFVDQELPLGCGKFLPDNLNLVLRHSVLHRSLVGEGSHRHLSSSIRFSFNLESTSELRPHECDVILIERLPSGVYADPFELQHLLQRGVFSDIAVFGDANLESPSFLSNRSAVEINMDIDLSILSGHKNEVVIKVELPLHARYAPLSESGYWDVKFGEPDLFMRCSVEGKAHNQNSVEGKSHNQCCLYMIKNDDDQVQHGTILWKIPSGIKAHAGVVYVFTFVSAFLSSLLIVLTSIFYTNINGSKNSKQS